MSQVNSFTLYVWEFNSLKNNQENDTKTKEDSQDRLQMGVVLIKEYYSIRFYYTRAHHLADCSPDVEPLKYFSRLNF